MTESPGNDNPYIQDGVAIIGMALRVPGASNLRQFWQNLLQGVESTTFFSDEQLRAAGVPDASFRDPNYVKACGVLEGADLFDAGFFDMPPREAEVLDPQHRQMMECAWEALEHAGYAPGTKAASTLRIGLFGGVGLNGYLLHNLATRDDLIETMGGWHLTLGNDKDFAATRVAYKLDLRGPAINISTACSTSLVSTVMACQSLLSYQCDMVVAGGCSIHLPQDQGYWFHPGGTLSPDGHCRAFDAAAQGTLDGNGVAMVVLKRLEDAVADGDTIHAVIRGFAVNNDGALKVGYTAPSVEGQSAVIREALQMADIAADSIGYVETHGTGTDLGDMVEITALTEAFRASSQRNNYCALGSVKTNIGHLDTAAGAASLIKTALSLSHAQIPPSLHFKQPSPRLGLETSPFYVNAMLRHWPDQHGTPRRAGVSSFGIGGTNAHVVLEEAAPPLPDGGTQRPWSILPLAARSDTALNANAQRLADYLRDTPLSTFADVVYTLQCGRRAFRQRQALVARDATEALSLLSDTHQKSQAEQRPRAHAPERPPTVVFLFPGQDAYYDGMARELYRDEPLFRREVDRCAAIARTKHGVDIVASLQGSKNTGFDTTPEALLLFVVEYSLARFWLALGVKPQAMLGYSLGEYVCACLADVIELEDAMMLAVVGSRLLSVLTPGPVVAVSLPEHTVRSLLTPGVGLAIVTAPRQCVVGARDDASMRIFKQRLEEQGASYIDVPLGYPFHTEFMEPFIAPYRIELQKVRFKPPTIAYMSCVTGDWIRAEEAIDPDHYIRLAGQTLNLVRGFEGIFGIKDAVLLEVSPGRIMTTFSLMQSGRPANLDSVACMRDPRFTVALTPGFTTKPGGIDEQGYLTQAVARLWTLGVDIDWAQMYLDEKRRRIPLPTYAFDHQRYWADATKRETRASVASPAASPQVGKLVDPAQWFYWPSWQEAPLPAPSRKIDKLTGHWLLAGGGDAAIPFASLLATRLQAAGASVDIAVNCATSNAAGWDSVLNTLADQGKSPQHIVYLGLLTNETGDDELLLECGFYAITALGQALGRRMFSESMAITVVASALFPVGESPIAPAKAAVLGPLRVIPQEYPNLRCRALDIGIPPPLKWQRERLLDALMAEWHADDRAVVLRPGKRYVERFEPFVLPELAAGPQPTLRAVGVYLITGGLGNIGLALAHLIASHAPNARLVLTTRQPWFDDGTGERVRQVRALRALGATVRVVRVDVADANAMTGLIGEIERDYGGLHGVIHAAGLIGAASFATVGESTRSFCTAQLAPKLQGARVLEKALGERPLDFCLLCSSLSSILGGLGFTGYAAANACLDAIELDHNRRHPTRWLSVNWEGWRFETENITGAGAGVAELGLTADEGCDAFLRILATVDCDRIVVSTGNLTQRIHQWIDLTPAVDTPIAASTRHARPATLGAYVAPDNATEEEVARLWQRLLGIDGISIHDSFFELGGNSLLLTQLLAQLRKTFRLELSLTSLFERPTIADTATLIEATRAQRDTLATSEDREEGEI
jgi:acyl transferase domain-containing protein